MKEKKTAKPNVNRSSCIRRLQPTQKMALQPICCPPNTTFDILSSLSGTTAANFSPNYVSLFFQSHAFLFFLYFAFVLFPSLTKSKYAAAAGASAGGHKGLVIILNHEFCMLDLTPVAPDYSFFFLLFLLFVPSNRATTGGI